MAHPFFDALTYPLDRPDARRLRTVLTQAISVPQRVNSLYNECLGGLPPLALLGNPVDVIWTEALGNLTAHHVLKVLLDKIAADATLQAPEIQQAVRDVINAEPAASQQQIISETVLVLDRVALRGKLAKLESDTELVKVILVRGDPDSGKSHGRYLFHHVANTRGALFVYLRDGMVFTVNDVVKRLFSTLEASDKIPPRDAPPEAWYITICADLLEATKSKKRPLWIAMDSLGLGPDGAPLLDKQIRDFFEQFALNMMDPAFAEWFRLMLIHYPDGPEPAQWEADFWTADRTSATDIKEEHVIDLLQKWLDAHDRKMHEDEVAELAKEVIAKGDAPDEPGVPPLPRLRRIHNAMMELIATLGGAPV